MALSRLIGVVLVFCSFALPSQGQNPGNLVNETFIDAPLESVLENLSQTYGVDITYGHRQVEPYTLSIRIKNKSVSETLKNMLKGTDLVFYQASPNHYVIKPNDQSLEIRGTILDNSSQKPIFGSGVVSLTNKKVGAWLNEDGSFYLKLEKSKHRDDTLKIFAFEHEPKFLPVKKLLKSYNKYLTITLEPKELRLDSVTINADYATSKTYVNKVSSHSKTIKMEGSAGNFQFDPSKLGYMVGIGGSDPLRILQTLPGIASLGESASNLNIRGSSSEENEIILDGITIYNGDRFMGLIGSVNHQAIQNVRLHSSGYDVKFGGRTGGVIEMEGRPLKSIAKSKTVNTGIDILNYSSFIEAPIKKANASFMLAVRSSLSGFIETQPYQKLVDERITEGIIFSNSLDSSTHTIYSEPRYTFYDINGKLNWLLGNKHILSLSAIKGTDRLQYKNREFDPDNSASRESNHNLIQNSHGASLNWNYYWKGENDRSLWSQTRLVYSGIDNSFNYSGLDINQDSRIQSSILQDKTLHDLSLQHHTNWEVNETHTLEGGFDIQRLSLSLIEQRITEDSILTYQQFVPEQAWIPTAYLQDKWEPTENITVKYGSRYSYLIGENKSMLAPRASFRLLFKNYWTFMTSAGRYNQYLRQTQYVNDLGYGEFFWKLGGNDSIPILQSDHFQTGIAYENEKWKLGVETYAKRISGLTTNKSEDYNVNTFRFVPNPDSTIIGGTGLTYGLDLYAKYEHKFFLGWVSYTWSNTRYQFDELNGGLPFSANQDRRHMVKLVNLFKWERFNFSAVFTWMSGNPITEIVGVFDIKDPITKEVLYRFPDLSESRNGNKLPDYHRLDLTSTWRLIDRDGLRANMGISVFNAYNRRNVRDWIPNSPSANGTNPSANSLQTRNLLGVSPNLFINLEF